MIKLKFKCSYPLKQILSLKLANVAYKYIHSPQPLTILTIGCDNSDNELRILVTSCYKKWQARYGGFNTATAIVFSGSFLFNPRYPVSTGSRSVSAEHNQQTGIGQFFLRSDWSRFVCLHFVEQSESVIYSRSDYSIWRPIPVPIF